MARGVMLVCLYGAPGVGKLSAGRELERLTRYIFIHDHLTIETSAAVFPFGTASFSKLRSTLFSKLLDAACSTRRGIIVTHADDIFWDPPFDQIVVSNTSRYGYDIQRVFLNCADHEHEKRICDPQRAQYQKIASMERLRRLFNAGEFEPRVPAKGELVIDTTAMTPHSVANTIVSALHLVQIEESAAGQE
jgi:predicted anti-sigma-YlaC factor YlaD